MTSCPQNKNISDDLIGQDEKVCSCSVKIAEMIISGEARKESKPSLLEIIAELSKEKD